MRETFAWAYHVRLALVVAVVLVGVGCGPLPAVSPVPAVSSSASDLVGTPVELVSVTDGDTIKVRLDGEVRRVRLLGIDTPERGECGADDATARLRVLLGGSLRLVADPVAGVQDRYERLLAYVEVGGRDVGLVLIEEGLAAAWWPRKAATPTRGSQYKLAHATAVGGGVGSWGKCGQVGRP